MKKIIGYVKNNWPYFILLSIVVLLFYKTFMFGKIPFPGDLMLSEYAPFRHTAYFGYAAGGIPSKGQYFDVVRELYPWKTLTIKEIKEGNLPLWNPYNFSGTPLLANYQSQTFYPLGILYLILPQPMAWTILVILQLLLGMIFMYIFTKEIGLSKPASLLSAITFNISSFATSWIEFNTVWHTILWLPLLLYIVERAIAQKTLRLSQQLVFMFSLFSSITAGHPQDFINTFFIFILYCIFRTYSMSEKTIKTKIIFFFKQFGLIIVIPFFLAAAQLFPTIELFTISSRVPHDLPHILSTMLVQFWQLPLLIYQDFFGNPATKTYTIPDTYVGKTLSIGVIGFILAIWSFFSKKKLWHWKFFVITAGIILCISINSPFTALLYKFPLPILSTGTPTRNLFILMFALSILAAFGFDTITKKTNKLKQYCIVGIGIIFIAWVASRILPISYPVILSNVVTKSALIITGLTLGSVVLLILSKRTPIFLYGLIILSVAELGYGFIKFNPFVPPSFLYPQNEVFTYLSKNAGLYRFWGYGTTRVESNINAQYALFSTDGTDPLNLHWYNQFIQASSDGNLAKIFSRFTRSDASLAPGYGARDLPDNPYRLRIMDLLGVKYVLDRPENPKDNTTFDSSHFIPLVTLPNQYTIFENIRAYPRAFLAGTYLTYDSIENFEDQFFQPSFNPREVVLLPNDINGITIQPGTYGNATILSYKPQEVVIKTESDSPKLLFLSDSYAPGWIAYVDQVQTEIYRANYAFRAIFVPEGIHTVRFMYKPLSVSIGIAISTIGVIFLLILIGFKLKRST